MTRLGVAVWAVMTAAAFAQSDDVYRRLRQALPGADGELAVSELSARDFPAVERRLSGTGEPSQELLSLRGAVAFLAGHMESAITDFEKAAALGRLKEGDSFTLAMALVRVGNHARARGVLDDLTAKDPQRAIYVYWLGRLDYDQRRYQEAVEKLEKAVHLDAKSARAWDGLGLAFDMQGRGEEAQAAFDKAVELNRQQAHPSPWPPHNLGYWLLRADRTKEAEAMLRESLRYDNRLMRTHYYLGRALEKAGREGEAIDEYQIAAAGDGGAADVCYSLGMLYRKVHRDAEANAMFTEYKKRKEALPVPSVTRPDGAVQ